MTIRLEARVYCQRRRVASACACTYMDTKKLVKPTRRSSSQRSSIMPRKPSISAQVRDASPLDILFLKPGRCWRACTGRRGNRRVDPFSYGGGGQLGRRRGGGGGSVGGLGSKADWEAEEEPTAGAMGSSRHAEDRFATQRKTRQMGWTGGGDVWVGNGPDDRSALAQRNEGGGPGRQGCAQWRRESPSTFMDDGCFIPAAAAARKGRRDRSWQASHSPAQRRTRRSVHIRSPADLLIHSSACTALLTGT